MRRPRLRLNLPCRRRAALEGDVVANTAEELPAKAEGFWGTQELIEP